MRLEDYSPKKIFLLGLVAVLIIVGLLTVTSIIEQNDANTIMVIQSPWDGQLSFYNTAGVKWQGFGKVTRYPKRAQFWFSKSKDQGEERDQSIKIRFNDAAHAQVSGSLSWYMPLSDSLLTKVHTAYGSPEAIEGQLIRTVTEKSVYMAGPLMSSKESYSEKRNDLIGYIDDQIVHGVYKTFTRQIQDKDPMTGAPRTIGITEIVKDPSGSPKRQDDSPISQFGIRIDNLSLNSIDYEEQVEKQIQQQQQAIQQVQLARAKAMEAEQQAITAAKNGEARAAESKWEQEVIKAKYVTEAQQKLEIAALEAKTAEQYKRKKILEAEGDAEYKRKIIVADGALTQKLEAWTTAQEYWADAFAKYQGNVVPSIIAGGTGKEAGFGPTTWMQLLGMQAAKSLELDMSIKKK